MGRLKKLKKIRIHREGTHILWASFLLLLLINAALYWGIDCKIPFYVVAVASIAVYLLMVNFFRCPIRLLIMNDGSSLHGLPHCFCVYPLISFS